jgi:hypothetical protein
MYKVLLAFTIITAPLMAATIGNVEYQLPPANGWKILNEIKNDKSTTIVYIPENCSVDDTEEFFAVHVNTLAKQPLDQDSLKGAIQILFPEAEIGLTILEQDPCSVIYEWTVDGELQCLSRTFCTNKELVMISYHTEQLSKFETDRPLWLQVLKSAALLH